jgi:hypothetical protein
LSDYIEQQIINLAKREIYSPEEHGSSTCKWPVQYMGSYYLVEFEYMEYQGEKKWVYKALHEHKGGFKRPEWLLY